MLCSLLGIECELAAAFILGFILDALPGMSGTYQAHMSPLLENDLKVIMLVTFAAPVMEELIFRLLILSFARKYLPFFAANIIQAGLFGIYHMSLVQGIYAFLLGLFIGYLMKCTGTVINCICFHIAFNISGLLIDDLMPDNLHIAVRMIILIIAAAGSIYTLMKLVKNEEVPVYYDKAHRI